MEKKAAVCLGDTYAKGKEKLRRARKGFSKCGFSAFLGKGTTGGEKKVKR